MLSASPGETETLGAAWAAALRPGDTVLLSGELGSGKTTLVRGLARGLGVAHGVKSPTFAIHLTHPGRIPLHHLDLYRIRDARDLVELGLEDLLGRDGVAVIEWGERLGDIAPPDALRVALRDDVRGRRITVEGPAAGVARWREALPPGHPAESSA